MSHPLVHPKARVEHDSAHKKKQPSGGNDPIADIVTQISAISQALSQIASDVGQLGSSPSPSPAPAPTPTPAPTPSPGSISWPTFTGDAVLVGKSQSGMVSVYLDANLQSNSEAMQNASDLQGDADRIVNLNNSIFAIKEKTPVNVLLYAMGGMTDGTGGADHIDCTFQNGGNIEVCVSYGNSSRCSALFMAELSECAMNGQLCGYSTGEALSRWCTMVSNPGALSDFASAPTWYADGMANWVDNTEPSDQDYDSIGCGMAFISYLIHREATLPQIAQQMVKLGDSGTLAKLYNVIGMGPQNVAWQMFSQAVTALGGVSNDDPFGQTANAMIYPHPHV